MSSDEIVAEEGALEIELDRALTDFKQQRGKKATSFKLLGHESIVSLQLIDEGDSVNTRYKIGDTTDKKKAVEINNYLESKGLSYTGSNWFFS